ncbi:DUF2314 domain-containing protein [Nocardioides ferulae]|uniref:DUF2314 domain-containing protein n=1 Tax=Nocardioides ferulae TaxID=2340821 RepID=UPI000EACD8C6|nr:DUF2314 domain-containing protein [Nocardioides ferulae]
MTTLRAVSLPADDPALAEAGRAARETFRFCWRHVSWRQRGVDPGLGPAMVKAAFPGAPGEPGTEHLWVEVESFDGVTVAGPVLNEPIENSAPSAGTPVEIRLADVEDWLYSVDGKACGGFTVQLIRLAMGRRQRRRHDRTWGLDFGRTGVISLVPDEAMRADTDEHPLSVAGRDRLRQIIAEDPAVATRADENGWTVLHQEAVAGNATLVEVLLEHGADPHARLSGPGSLSGATALDLAVGMGWEHVAEAFTTRGGAR